MHKPFRVVLPVLAITGLLLAGCATTPAPLAGDFPDFQPNQATERSLGAVVRWGGHVIETRPGRERTCIELLARPLDRDLRPAEGDHHFGRFLACREGFVDPAMLSEGRAITVIGRLTDFTDGTIGEFVYRYPTLDADTLYIWPETAETVFIHDPWWPYYDPWWPHRSRAGARTRVSGSVIIIR